RLLESDRFVERGFGGRGAGTDFLELADVRVVPLGRRLQRPGRRDAILSDIEQSGTRRREQPLVQADTVEIHREVAQLEREVRQRVGAVDDGGDAALA